MKKLDRYVWRELFVPFLIGTVAVALMFSINQLMAILKEISLQGVPREAILLSLLYKLPFWLNMTLPVGMSLAASLAFTRFARESELTAIRAAGAPILRTVLPVTMFGVLVAIGNFFLVERVMPPAERRFSEVAAKIGILGVLPEFRANAVLYLKEYTATFGTVSRAPGDVLQLTDVLLIQRPKPGETWFISADTGEYRDGHWVIENTLCRMFRGDDLYQVQTEDRVDIYEKVIVDSVFAPPSSQTLTLGELRRAITEGRRMGMNTRIQEVALHTKFSVPAACLVFATVAPIFAIVFARTGGFAGVLLSIFLVMLYYNAFIVSTEIFGRNGWLNPILAAWLPNVIFAFLGLIALRRLE